MKFMNRKDVYMLRGLNHRKNHIRARILQYVSTYQLALHVRLHLAYVIMNLNFRRIRISRRGV